METFIPTDKTIEFNGVTIRKAMFPNGDYVDLKAFAANERDSNRQLLRNLVAGQEVALDGKLRFNAKGFREYVLNESTPRGMSKGKVHPMSGNFTVPDTF